MGRPYKCPHCGVAGKNVAKGYRYNKAAGKVRLRKCISCGRRWTVRASYVPCDDSACVRATEAGGDSPSTDDPNPEPRGTDVAANGDEKSVEATEESSRYAAREKPEP